MAKSEREALRTKASRQSQRQALLSQPAGTSHLDLDISSSTFYKSQAGTMGIPSGVSPYDAGTVGQLAPSGRGLAWQVCLAA